MKELKKDGLVQDLKLRVGELFLISGSQYVYGGTASNGAATYDVIYPITDVLYVQRVAEADKAEARRGQANGITNSSGMKVNVAKSPVISTLPAKQRDPEIDSKYIPVALRDGTIGRRP